MEKPGAEQGRIAASKQCQLHQIVDVRVKSWPQTTKKFSLYLLDWDNASGGRQTSIDVLDGNTGNVLDSRIINNYQDGKYVTYTISGHVQFRLTRFFKENIPVPRSRLRRA